MYNRREGNIVMAGGVSLANVQLENGYTRIANELLDVVIKTPFIATHLKIVLVCWRYMYGFNRKEAELSETFISKATGISKRYISKEMKALIDAKIVKVVTESTYTAARIISFNKNYEQWEYRTTVPQVNHSSTVESQYSTTVEPQFNTTVEPQFHQETKTIKKTIKKDIYIKVQHLSMTEEEYNRLVEHYGKTEVDEKIEAAENYAKLKNYKSLYLTLNKWLKADGKEEKPRKEGMTAWGTRIAK
jgi:phage replication O-like protein O